ncbi:MAG: 23S rRNA (adenine(2503)-C(2))-methyltransferase RlmN [Clostridiales Family XIII bacterium]|jgi:23S rRNA (adenine2503-C2)-methyltransferase|nr:23S rRNA (adenine(2503)-C(2))-methyltransferase RlmN [Clostridiales Family XIII bacterium]
MSEAKGGGAGRREMKNMTLEEMRGFFLELGEKPFRASQVWRWLYGAGVTDFGEMANLPAALRERLAEVATSRSLEAADVRASALDGTRKFLFRTRDGHFVEGAFMKYDHGNSVCVSSQAGCRMGCAFCASGVGGLKRGLTAGEMAEQVLLARRDAGEKVSHVVVMGVGEPLENFDELARFVGIMAEGEGLGMSKRNITVSTCGVIPGIRRMAEEMPQVGLAVSLHAPDDELRSRLMPVNRSYGIAALLDAARGHVARTGRRVTFEYALIKGVNDSRHMAERLAARLSGINCHVNLIPLNEVKAAGGAEGRGGRRAARGEGAKGGREAGGGKAKGGNPDGEAAALLGSERKEAELFKVTLERAGVTTTIRRSLGKDIQAACGQLRAGRAAGT